MLLRPRSVVVGVTLACIASLPGYSQPKFASARDVIARVHNDLQQADADARKGKKGEKDLERVNKAEKSLSDLDKKLTKDKYDKGKVEHLLNEVKSVRDHNTLSPQSRDALQLDVDDLRRVASGEI